MLQSTLPRFIKKEFPKDEEAYNAQILVRAGFIDKLMAGVYTYLPLGLRVIKKIERVIKKHMDNLGAHEIVMPMLHPKENWQKTKRWDELDVLFKIAARDDKEYALGPTHEEIVTPLAQKAIFSYQELPLGFYQIQTKFRDEPRAKSGILRGREFIMKDLYSFHSNEEDLHAYYERVEQAYERIFVDIGIAQKTYKTFASGGTFSPYSHEYQTVFERGEDTIFICSACRVAVNKEIISQQSTCPSCGSADLVEQRASEVANIFKLQTKYSAPFELCYTDKEGSSQPVLMGCYGMGVSRLMGICAELFHDDRGLIWPSSIAPFDVHVVALYGSDANANESITQHAHKVYETLIEHGVEVLFDDRLDVSAGEKFAESDLIGIPVRMVISAKTGDRVEVKYRTQDAPTLVDFSDITQYGRSS
ncbi:MAG: hypothetical protein KBC26_02700 [Candidatus Pacebacteria bacterium]|nr:hypothetical protein [Candidatus Paceibacterota bacterium]